MIGEAGRFDATARRAGERRDERRAERDRDDGYLRSFLHPLTPEELFGEYWEKKPYLALHRDRLVQPPLLSIADVDALIQLTTTEKDIKIVKMDGEDYSFRQAPRSADGSPDIFSLYRAHQDGYTIIVYNMQRRWGPVADLCRSLEAALHHRVRGNLYFTPPRSQGFSAHYDTEEVFVLQLEGSKLWRLYGVVPSPLDDDHRQLRREDIGELSREIVLQAGDLLYIPRGHIHEALSSEDGPSLHVTIGVHVSRWVDVLQEAVLVAAESTPSLREALPVGFLGAGGGEAMERRLQEIVGALDLRSCAESAVGRFREKFVQAEGPKPDGQFASLSRTQAIDLDTIVERRAGFECTVFGEGGQAGIRFRGNTVVGPAHVEPAFRFVAAATRFAVQTLPDSLSDNAKVVLARRLVKEGLLAIVGSEG